MKSILMPIQPKWVKKIISGEKIIEVRKTAPKEVPFKVYIYETKGASETPWVDEDGHFIYKGSGKVIGEFICDKVEAFAVGSLRCDDIEKLSCLSYTEMITYFYKPEELDGNTAKWGKALHITALKIYDKPKELSDFYSIKQCKPWTWEEPLARPPQSWQYIQEKEECKEE